MQKVNFYHGTSTIFDIKEIRPSIYTGILREDRNKSLDIVFLSRSKVSAEFYAKKACEKFGGLPIVYKAMPQGDFIELNNNELICDWAIIVD